ncbi:MAG: hypothetical protein KDD62_14145 [Bdellovibrionales bacterium]|nr:hypothetical protein [Bdellovibrionales bacterium]
MSDMSMFASRVARIVLDDSINFSYSREGGGGFDELRMALNLLEGPQGIELSDAMFEQYLMGDSLDMRLFEGVQLHQQLTSSELYPELLRQFKEFVEASDGYRKEYLQQIGIASKE